MNKFALPILITIYLQIAKGCLVTELTPPHTQNILGFKGEMIQTVRLAVCCNYLKKKTYKLINVIMNVVGANSIIN